MADSLVFMAPFDLKVVAPGAVEWRMTETEQENERDRKLKEEIKRQQEQEESGDDDGDLNVANETNEEEQKQDDAPDPDTANVITPQKFDAIYQQQKSKEICVLSIGERWWDLENDTMDVVFQRVQDEHIAHLILEYSGLGWAMIQFPYPLDDGKDGDTKAMMLQGAQSEVFESGTYGAYNVLLLAKIARDPRTKIFNHWVFSACAVPKTFGEMWRNPKIQKGVIGKITNVDEQSNLKPVDGTEP